MARKRFNTARVCTSENYEISHRAYKQELVMAHSQLQQMLIKEEIVVKKTAYIKVFGRFVPLTSVEIPLYEGKTEIIWK